MNATASKKTELSKRGKQPSTYRRIVTGNVNGKSIVQSDEQLQAYQFKSVPDYEHTLVWATRPSRTFAGSKGLTATPTRSFRDRAAQVFTS
jgi:hypothetical protein